MKIIYEFCHYEDREELEVFQKAHENALIIENIKEELRKRFKYEFMTAEVEILIKVIRNILEGE